MTHTARTTRFLSSKKIQGRIDNALRVARDLAAWPFAISLYNEDSNEHSEEYAIAGQAPAMRQWENGRKSKRLSASEVVIANSPFEATMHDYKRHFQNDKSGILQGRIDELVARSTTHWARMATDLLELGKVTTVEDGQAFFSKSHQTGDSPTQSNLLDATDIPDLQVGTANDPTPEEMARILTKVAHHFYSLKDDVNEPLHEDALRFLCMVPINMGGAARQAISANLLNTGAGSVDNMVNAQRFTLEVQENPRFTSDTTIQIHRVDAPFARSLVLQQNGPVNQSAKAEGSEYEHDTGEWEFGIDAVRGGGFGNWTVAIEAELSQA